MKRDKKGITFELNVLENLIINTKLGLFEKT